MAEIKMLGKATPDMTVEQALKHALFDDGVPLKEVLVIGVRENGVLFVVSSKMGTRDAYWLGGLVQEYARDPSAWRDDAHRT